MTDLQLGADTVAQLPSIASNGSKVPIRTVGREIRFVGLKRSGNHAVLNWIIRQSEGSLLHFNNVRPDDPYQDWALTTRQGEDFERVDQVVYSIEDTSLAVVGDPSSYPQGGRYPRLKVGARTDILVLRDPFNLAASRVQRGGDWGRLSTYVSGISFPQMWVTYALESLGRSRWLSRDLTTVNYNRWCRSREYRRQLASRLGLSFTDEGFREVTAYGGGSSFESREMDGRADLMRTDQRWKKCRGDADFESLFRDPLLLDLVEELFELDDELAAWVNDDLRPRATRSSALARWWSDRVGQRVVARLRRSGLLRRLHRGFIRDRRARKLPMPGAQPK